MSSETETGSLLAEPPRSTPLTATCWATALGCACGAQTRSRIEEYFTDGLCMERDYCERSNRAIATRLRPDPDAKRAVSA